MQKRGIRQIKKITNKEICRILEIEEATFSRWKKTRPKLYGVVQHYFRIISAASLVDMTALAATKETVTALIKIQNGETK